MSVCFLYIDLHTLYNFEASELIIHCILQCSELPESNDISGALEIFNFECLKLDETLKYMIALNYILASIRIAAVSTMP